jgi:peptide/nickel transport system ATP-binding protein
MSAVAAAVEPRPAPVAEGRPLVEVEHLSEFFPIVGGVLQRKIAEVRAVDDVSFSIRRGETLGLVGESGCGKTTVGRVLLRLIEPTGGRIVFDGKDITSLRGPALKPYRRRMQIIFQDPYASLDPRTPIGASIGEGLRIHGIGSPREQRDMVAAMMELVGLQPYHARRYPHEFSGGQRQRIGIARALVFKPDLLVCDEPVSALDVSIQAQVLNLLRNLQRELGLTYLFIAHNMGVVEHISDRVAVMYLGSIAELADSEEIYRLPLHPYTIALLSAVPVASPRARRRRRRIILLGDVPSPVNPPSGCRFHTRCWLRRQLGNPERCVTERPALRDVRPDHEAACHFAEELLPGAGREALIAEAARSSSPFETSEDEATAPVTPPPPDTGGVFDPTGTTTDEEAHRRL